MRVVEHFLSINGEGEHAGELAYFIRFQYCPLHCHYCDTSWANDCDTPFQEMSPQEIFESACRHGIRNITLTGGEPLVQNDLPDLLALLVSDGRFRVEVETSGAVDLIPFISQHRPFFTMDYKLPGSGEESKMCLSNFSLLQKEDTVKFVCADIHDLNTARQITEKYQLLRRCHVHLSAVYDHLDYQDIVSYMIKMRWNGVRLQPQLHKWIWSPEKHGV